MSVLAALGPYRENDNSVADGDDDGGEDKKSHSHKCHVQLPLPGLTELDPALGPPLDQLFVVKKPDRDGQDDRQGPGDHYKQFGSSP